MPYVSTTRINTMRKNTKPAAAAQSRVPKGDTSEKNLKNPQYFPIFNVIKNEPWYKPDVFLFKDMIIVLAKHKKMEEAMQVWKDMRSEKLEPDMVTYTEVIRGFLQYGSPSDAMNIYEEMKKSPHPPEELPYRVLLKGLFPNPLLRNKVKQDFEETFPERHVYDPPEELFGMH